MYNIIEQHQNHSSSGNRSVTMLLLAANETVLTTTSGGFKIDCAKECPCNVPVIPVPDQWLEVMVTGGFKVWHIIFIIIAFLVTIVVVYCCFHRCRIPRTKQEIEADLMRTNLTTKFRDYLQEFPNEPTTFLEALKKVQELEEKWVNEQDDLGAKKRMGWLKLRGKDRQTDKGAASGGAPEVDEEPATAAAAAAATTATTTTTTMTTSKEVSDAVAVGPVQLTKETGNQPVASLGDAPDQAVRDEKRTAISTSKQSSNDEKVKTSSGQKESTTKKSLLDFKLTKVRASEKRVITKESSRVQLAPAEVSAPAVKLQKTRGEKVEPPSGSRVKTAETGPSGSKNTIAVATESGGSNNLDTTVAARQARPRKKRDKPNLSRTKATHVVSRGDTIEAPANNVLAIPVATSHRRHHHHHHHHQQQQQQEAAVEVNKQQAEPVGNRQTLIQEARKDAARSSKPYTHRRPVSKKDSTVIQIGTDVLPPPS